MDQYTVIILLTIVGFCTVAAILLVPVYLFLRREERRSQDWTDESLARRARERRPGSNGSSAREDVRDV